jgi:G3E family GTPase
LRDRGEAADEEDDRNVADLLLDQVEFANVIVLNKIDLVTEKESKQLAALLQVLNPDAKVVKSVNGVVSLADIIATNTFSFEKASRSAGWLQVLFFLLNNIYYYYYGGRIELLESAFDL